MFNIFRKKKKANKNPSISEAILECKKRGFKNLSIQLYIENQILFQVELAKHYINKGLKTENNEDMVIIHFFNKNKTLTLNTWEKFKTKEVESLYFHYEEPKGVFIYLKNVGFNPKMIEEEIHREMLLYELGKESNISIQYSDYNTAK